MSKIYTVSEPGDNQIDFSSKAAAIKYAKEVAKKDPEGLAFIDVSEKTPDGDFTDYYDFIKVAANG